MWSSHGQGSELFECFMDSLIKKFSYRREKHKFERTMYLALLSLFVYFIIKIRPSFYDLTSHLKTPFMKNTNRYIGIISISLKNWINFKLISFLSWLNTRQVFSNASRISRDAFTQCSASSALRHRTGLTQEVNHAPSATFVAMHAQSGPAPTSGRCSVRQIPNILMIAFFTHSAAHAPFAKILVNLTSSTKAHNQLTNQLLK